MYPEQPSTHKLWHAGITA